MKKKHLRTLYILPASSWITLLVFAYRYMWFAAETIPGERIFVAAAVALFSSFLVVLVELEGE